ncbi:hypothetical protein AVEN_162535-1 [Araneus ventricosus]|uniref:Uncharacterized protein n=1 Tax=Araneus ventricosus TaxID=182803 RepID=A0A4Y2I6K1_ARAVE|nr:hypothetical protein AVEN_162535-1 [Araneus ventricosus]
MQIFLASSHESAALHKKTGSTRKLASFLSLATIYQPVTLCFNGFQLLLPSRTFRSRSNLAANTDRRRSRVPFRKLACVCVRLCISGYAFRNQRPLACADYVDLLLA